MGALSKILTACVLAGSMVASSGVMAAGKGLIGVSLPNKTEARWVSDGSNLAQSLKDKGYDVDLQYAQYEVQTQLSQVENMLVKGVKVLVVAPIDGTTMTDTLQLAKSMNIPVISYDRLIRNSPNVDYYATFDNRQTGVLQGKDIVEKLGLAQGKGPFTLEIFSGSLDDNNAHVVYDGVMSQLKPYIDSGKLVVRSGQVTLEQTSTLNWDGAVAQSRMDNILSSFYANTHLDAVLAMNDAIATGVTSSLRGIGYGSGGSAMPVITGQDAELPNVKAIIQGNQTSTVFKDTRALAFAAADMVDAVLAGAPVKVNDNTSYNNGIKVIPTQLLTPVLVDKSNWKNELFLKAKYYSEDQLK
ncbi:sugar-binding protein (plasmid) [Azospirillum oryzae]|uniref:Sugar-binding protein n=1 Tax=Azospirillum oryzae TaxID=286727 RepID=A0A6N1B5M9_9PROT|nr:multiple monosaccharide ABC transporter substrate-binding protein [Azospirillum oryzae]KAA0585417.1 sugar ABC transporter substrate-binding protein [Azospirillum oryzae]QKS54572.1 sugar-binding protein [Azospirillum oryzae]GLR77439.1 sugar ABC transporter substrate-binding protein [Azospirillum oryzae]